MIYTQKLETPIGHMIAGVTDGGICLFDFEYRKMLPAIKKRVSDHINADYLEQEHKLHIELKEQVDEYFQGARTNFDLPLIFSGTDFQKKVWNALLEVPFGEKRTYMQQTRVLGDEKAIRAVARANGENCLAIIVPCHRVVGSNGALTGYAGGLKAKKWLLEHETKVVGKAYQASIF